MLGAEQQNDFAGQVKQNLPDSTVLARSHSMAAENAARATDASSLAQASTGATNFDTQSTASPADIASHHGSSAHATLETLTGQINREAVLLRQFKPDKLEVVLHPDGNTQISLQLSQIDGVVHGVARCERGDYDLLNAHWSQLQRTLEQQGVNMAPLREAGSTLSFLGGNSFGNSSFQSYDQRARKLEDVIINDSDFTSANTAQSAVDGVRTRPASSLLQAWA
jgi:hypothetical protein